MKEKKAIDFFPIFIEVDAQITHFSTPAFLPQLSSHGCALPSSTNRFQDMLIGTVIPSLAVND
jgi:hypothetical protein